MKLGDRIAEFMSLDPRMGEFEIIYSGGRVRTYRHDGVDFVWVGKSDDLNPSYDELIAAKEEALKEEE